MNRSIASVILVVMILFSAAACLHAENSKAGPVRSLGEIEKELKAFKPDPKYKEDSIAFEVVKQALISIREGSFGIGACIVNEKDGKMVVTGHNELLLPYFRSDKHAEMAVLDKYEDMVKRKNPKTEGLVLYSSLEPCPMCTIRLLSGNVKKVRYVSPDIDGGFIHHMGELPPYWKNQIFDKDYAELDCSPRLKEISYELLNLSLNIYGDRLK